MTRPIACLAALLLLVPPALAEPAVIARFETIARAAPSRDGAPLQTLIEGTAVSVSEEAEGGWRRVRLADGRTGWIEERDLAFPARAAPTPVGPASPAAPAQPAPPLDLRPKIYVKDLDHLSELVGADPLAGPKARSLVQRRTGAIAVGAIGLAASVALVVMGSSEFSRHNDLNDPQFGNTGSAGVYFGAAAATAGLAVLVAFLVAPKGADLLDVINAWNTNHPEQQFTVGEHAINR